jgi:ribonuclease P protein component
VADHRLRRRAEFVAAATGPRAPTPAFVLQMRLRDDAGAPRFGFTASRKVGNAVERNRARRRLKEMMRLTGVAQATSGRDYVLVARRGALTHPFERLASDFSGALRRLAQGQARDRGSRRGKGRSASDDGGKATGQDVSPSMPGIVAEAGQDDLAGRTRVGAIATAAQPGPGPGKGS